MKYVANWDAVPSKLIQSLFIIFGIGLNLISINRSLIFGFNLIEQMAQDGFLPKRFRTSSNLGFGYLITILSIAGISVVLIHFTSRVTIIGITANAFLWIAAFSHLPDLFQSRSHLPEWRKPKLPFHPLFPGITIVIGFLMPLTLGSSTLLITSSWLVLGSIYFIGFARKNVQAVRPQESILSKPSGMQLQVKSNYRVMVSIANPRYAPALLRAGSRLAEARAGSLRILNIVPINANTPRYRKGDLAESEWQALSKLVSYELGEQHNAQILVRLAPKIADGINETVTEEQIDLLILG